MLAPPKSSQRVPPKCGCTWRVAFALAMCWAAFALVRYSGVVVLEADLQEDSGHEPARAPAVVLSDADRMHLDEAINNIDLPPWDERNPYVVKYVDAARRAHWQAQAEKRDAQKDVLGDMFGINDGHEKCWAREKRPYYDHLTYSGSKCAEGVDHSNDNRTNWVLARRKLCDELAAERERDFPVPDELRAWLRVLDERDPTPQAQPVDTVRDELDKLMAALYMFYEGDPVMHDNASPTLRQDADLHAAMMRGVALRLAVAIRRKRERADASQRNLVLGIIGDSTSQGGDNCYYDSWAATFERVFAPVAALFGLGLEVRNAGHGGVIQMLFSSASLSHACYGSMLGMEDVDVLVTHFPFVKVDAKTEVDLHTDLFARCIMQGTVVIVSYHATYEALKPFYPAGVMLGGTGGFSTKLHQWYPDHGGPRKFQWRIIGNGLCHINGTRSGSRAILQRNWHPGPLGNQHKADCLTYTLAKALRLSAEMLDTAERLGDVDRLCALGDRLRVKKVTLAGREVLVPPFALCGTHAKPVFGKKAALVEWVDLNASKGHWAVEHKLPNDLSGFTPQHICNHTEPPDDTLWTPFETDCKVLDRQSAPQQRDAFYPPEDVEWKQHRTMTYSYGDNIMSFERPRPFWQCRHLDGGTLITGLGHLQLRLPVAEARALNTRTRGGRIDHYRLSMCGRVLNVTTGKIEIRFGPAARDFFDVLVGSRTTPSPMKDDPMFAAECATFDDTYKVGDDGEIIDPFLQLTTTTNTTLWYVKLDPVMAED